MECISNIPVDGGPTVKSPPAAIFVDCVTTAELGLRLIADLAYLRPGAKSFAENSAASPELKATLLLSVECHVSLSPATVEL